MDTLRISKQKLVEQGIAARLEQVRQSKLLIEKPSFKNEAEYYACFSKRNGHDRSARF
jgi:hypothetical protein